MTTSDIEFDEVFPGDCLSFTRRNGQDERTGVVTQKTSSAVEVRINSKGPGARIRRDEWEYRKVRLNVMPGESLRLLAELIEAREEMQAASERVAEIGISWMIAELKEIYGIRADRLTSFPGGEILISAESLKIVIGTLFPDDDEKPEGVAAFCRDIVNLLDGLDIEAEPWPQEQGATGVTFRADQLQRLLYELNEASRS